MNDLSWELGGVALDLCPERAVWRADRREVMVADVHLGKAATFRRAGRPLPRGTTRSELARLDALVARKGAERLTILGDLFHADVELGSPTAERFAEWLERRARDVEITLVRGNHDRHARALIEALPLSVEGEGWTPDAGLAYLHHPPKGEAEGPWLAGHIHPGVRLEDGRDRMKLPVFWGSGAGLVLPAFGAFTGLWLVKPGTGDRLGAVTPTGVVEVPAALLSRD